MSTKGSVKAVVFSLAGNVVIGILKLVVAIFTKSAGMLAEAIHSFADSTNQVLLLIGSKRSKKEADEQHSFGYGKEEYFWGFMVAVLLFFMGGLYSIIEGIEKIHKPEAIDHVMWIFIVLISSIIIESKSFSVAFKEFKSNKIKSVSWVKHLKDSTDTNIFVIIIEDFAAVVGLLIVLGMTILAIFVAPIFDAIGSILIGLMLLSTSYFLSNELRKLMIGESISRDMRNQIKEILKSYKSVKHIINMRSMYVGNNEFMLTVSLDIDGDEHAHQTEHVISEMKSDINKKFPNARFINIETL